MSRFDLAVEHTDDMRAITPSTTDLLNTLGVDDDQAFSQWVVRVWNDVRTEVSLETTVQLLTLGMGVGRQIALFDLGDAGLLETPEVRRPAAVTLDTARLAIEAYDAQQEGDMDTYQRKMLELRVAVRGT